MWEYRLVPLNIEELNEGLHIKWESAKDRANRLSVVLTDIGKDGWELVLLIPGPLSQQYAVFKRPSPKGTAGSLLE